jgi:capsular exopolysaccharide synthesis family protein
MVNVHAEIRDLRSKIALEVNRIVQGMANDVTTARARETSLRDSIQGLQNSVAKQDEASVQLRELQREAETSRTLYENFLTRFKQTSEQQDIQQSDSRPVAVAKIPIGASYPKTLLILSFAFFASGIVGVLVALIIERLDNGFRSADQIQSIAGVASLGLVPAARAGAPIDIPIERPTSAYAESIRAVRTSLRYSNIDTPPRVILVTSSLPKEGKTTFSISLARSIAASGARVLLIDCDLRRPAVNTALGGAETSNLLELFSEGKPGPLLTTRDEKSGLDYIPVKTGTPNPQDLLSSQQMRSFLDEMRRQYDYIVLDAPPVLAVSDPLILAHIVDTTIFLVRWERTPRAVSLGALRLLQNNGGKLAGIVLSRVNVRKHAQYGYGDSGYYYGHYATYYGKS